MQIELTYRSIGYFIGIDRKVNRVFIDPQSSSNRKGCGRTEAGQTAIFVSMPPCAADSRDASISAKTDRASSIFRTAVPPSLPPATARSNSIATPENHVE